MYASLSALYYFFKQWKNMEVVIFGGQGSESLYDLDSLEVEFEVPWGAQETLSEDVGSSQPVRPGRAALAALEGWGWRDSCLQWHIRPYLTFDRDSGKKRPIP